MKLSKQQRVEVTKLLDRWKSARDEAKRSANDYHPEDEHRAADMSKEKTYDSCIKDVEKLFNL